MTKFIATGTHTVNTPLPYVALTNGNTWGNLTVNPSNNRFGEIKGIDAQNTGLYLGRSTAGSAAQYTVAGSDSGNTYVSANGGFVQLLRGALGANPDLVVDTSGGVVLGSWYDNTATPGAGNTRANGTMTVTGSLTVSNVLRMATNYTAANFIATAGLTKLVASNNAIYSVSTTSTNLIVAP
jgi:hypothetical protein